jgi:hypothetical protein
MKKAISKRDSEKKKRIDSTQSSFSEGTSDTLSERGDHTPSKKKIHLKKDSLGLDLSSTAFIETRDKRAISANSSFSPTSSHVRQSSLPGTAGR